jgi:hypothetical protein
VFELYNIFKVVAAFEIKIQNAHLPFLLITIYKFQFPIIGIHLSEVAPKVAKW